MEFTSFELTALASTYVVPFLINLAIAAAIFIIGRVVARALRGVVQKLLNKKADSDPMLTEFIGSIVYAIALTFVVIAALGRLGVQTTSLVAILGAAGLAIGLALQGSLANFAAGVMLLAFKPFRQGHFIEAGGVTGVVENIGIFSSTLRTGDNKEVIVPNGKIYGDTITNYSARNTRRVDLVYGIGYDDDIQKAKDVLNNLIATDPRILREPAPVVAVGNLGASSIDFYVRPWVAAADYWDVLFDLNERVVAAFAQHDISIPFPQMDVHLPGGVRTLSHDPVPAKTEDA
ncbi:mechanosensitive ion channel [Litorivicinus lipolyticus]|uniref:Small-conductance mechanosensitive channel n=1 Tax=Litorivicinus lipolyticus TaxID=418701 RepID=A0A5Q2QC65_9GAMM|nr:mechanosensitive ion channel domain-containing protein [Litorivicinus lipolyticus]QGG79872.1 mechanosensitive ion channel [Litorivicinus lipolyticus]